MIFVTVGAQMAFPRMINAIDAWADREDQHHVFAQIGPTEEEPVHIQWTRFLTPARFRAKISECELVIGHAGMGTIIGALVARKPLVIMPRRGDLHETRNDHQIATAVRFAEERNVTVAKDEHELIEILRRREPIVAPLGVGTHASTDLIAAIHRFAFNGSSVEVVANPFDQMTIRTPVNEQSLAAK